MPKGARNWLTPAAWVAAVSGVLLLVFPVGFPNYDTIYALVWGRELAHLESPDMGAALPPTPHPLTELWGMATTPLGDGMITLTMIGAYASLGLIGFFVYRLGSIWFDRWIGAVAAAIVLTRAPFLSNGLRAYIDLPYIALCLAALLMEAKRPRAGWPVLALLALAGLLRPEAWLFAIAYLVYLSFNQRSRESFSPPSPWLVVLAFSAPILWALFDLITTGSPTYSWTGTKETVETLERQTGPVDLLLYGPRRLGEVLQWPGMVGALGGVVLGLAFLRRRSALGAAAAALALGAFALLACGGLAILPRYTMLAAAILAIFAGVGLLGWRLLEPGHPWRRRWQVFAAIVLAMFLVWLPNQWDLDSKVDADLTNQARIERNLSDLVDAGAFEPLCGKVAVPNHRAVPRLAFNLDVKPTQIVSASEEAIPRRGYFVAPASPFVIHNFILDPNDPTDFSLEVPPGFEPVAANESWRVYRRC
ncbi:MAG TPA: glycosyltransferase family 39 protein [Solirubrobacterales bacterium]|nr:glycosyltransferase family 39 protein [Solirubrobacterales bacterium]